MKVLNCKLIFMIISVIWLKAFDSSILFAQKIETIDGIRVVSNDKPMWESEPKVSLSFVQRIGVFESKDENYMFFNPHGVAVDTEENIYVLDSGNLRIQKFDTNGKFISSFGRKGEGPAEFEYIDSFEVAKNGDIYVGDYSKWLMIVINQDGKEVRRFRFEKQIPAGFNILDSGEIIMRTQGGITFDLASHTTTRIDISNEKLMRKFDAYGKLLLSFCERKDFGDEAWNNYFRSNRINFTIDQDENIFVSFRTQNRIEKFSPDGKQLFRMDRRLNFEETTEKTMRTRENGRVYHYMRPVSRGIGVDGKGRIWVITYDKVEDAFNSNNLKFEIFSNDGIFLGELSFDSIPITHPINGFKVIYIKGSRLFLIDAFEEMSIFEYEIIEK